MLLIPGRVRLLETDAREPMRRLGDLETSAPPPRTDAGEISNAVAV
jgi:hypothetical protein